MKMLHQNSDTYFIQSVPVRVSKRILPDEKKIVGLKPQSLPQYTSDSHIRNDKIKKDERAFSALLQRNLKQQFQRRRTEQLQKEIDSLRKSYQFISEEEIIRFILKNFYLVTLLREAPTQIKRIYGESVKLILKLSAEPDFLQSTELWVLILTELPASKAFPLLEKLDKEWWLENIDRANCKLNISLEYI